MKVYVIVGLILLAGIAMVWVVVGTLLSGTGIRARYEVEAPPGRYDYFLKTQVNFQTNAFPAVSPAFGPFPAFPTPVHEDTRKFLGSDFRVGVYGLEATEARIAVEAAFDLIDRIATMADPRNRNSEVSYVNRNAAADWVELSEPLYVMIKRIMVLSEKSNGAVDVTSGPLRELWEEFSAAGSTPTRMDTGEALRTVGYKNVEINDKEKTIRFTKPGVTIDFHDVIRGFIADDVAWYLRKENNVKQGFISVDGMLHVLLGHPDGASFMLGIPDANGRLAHTFENDRVACVSKGYFKRLKLTRDMTAFFSGTVDPRSGGSPQTVASCTVIGPDATTCEAIATALCVVGGSRARVLLEEINRSKE